MKRITFDKIVTLEESHGINLLAPMSPELANSPKTWKTILSVAFGEADALALIATNTFAELAEIIRESMTKKGGEAPEAEAVKSN